MRLSVTAAAGTRVRLRHAERLKPDGTLYTENLRRATATALRAEAWYKLGMVAMELEGKRGNAREAWEKRLVTRVVPDALLEQETYATARRIAEAEAAWWRSEIIEPAIAAGATHVRLGSALLAELIRRAEGIGYRQLVAVIGDSAHRASIALHARHGFLPVGTLRSTGFKFGRWVDSVLMQRSLGEGDATRPVSR